LPAYVHRAAYWIARCRTAELGGHLRRCPAGHTERAFYNSCHQRICPQCQGLATERWLERSRARLLGCAHHHLIFTIPHELNALWCWNRAPMAKLLFGAVRETLMELLGDPRHLGAQPAFLAALHTWGRSLSLHPHVHVLAAAGRARTGWVTAALPLPAGARADAAFHGTAGCARNRRPGLRIPADTSQSAPVPLNLGRRSGTCIRAHRPRAGLRLPGTLSTRRA
jgi:hypothetical protein